MWGRTEILVSEFGLSLVLHMSKHRAQRRGRLAARLTPTTSNTNTSLSSSSTTPAENPLLLPAVKKISSAIRSVGPVSLHRSAWPTPNLVPSQRHSSSNNPLPDTAGTASCLAELVHHALPKLSQLGNQNPSLRLHPPFHPVLHLYRPSRLLREIQLLLGGNLPLSFQFLPFGSAQLPSRPVAPLWSCVAAPLFRPATTLRGRASLRTKLVQLSWNTSCSIHLSG